MKYICFCLLLIFLFTKPSMGQHAVPPSPQPVTVTLKDGSQIQLIGRGSDHIHWTETIDGYTVIRNDEGFYEYAIKQNQQLVGSGLRAFDPADRSLAQMRKLLPIPKNLAPGDDADTRTAHLAPLGSSTSQTRAAVPASGKVRLLAICIDYPDLPHTLSSGHMSRLLNEGVDGKPSFRDYFLQNSYGQLELQVDVAGWVTASNNYQYYGDENGKRRTRQLVQEALQEVDPTVDFSQYDNDGDGDVDGVIIIHSGPGAEEGGLRQYVWSHRWTVQGIYLDGKYIADYTIQPETRSANYGGEVGIGIFCHEFGHLLGLPDLYDTDGHNGWSHGIGDWGLMATGGWLGREDYPASLSAWSKAQLGWVSPRDISGQFGDFSLRPAHTYPDIIRIESGREGEYFLLENRQLAGFDAYLNGHGMAVWHINTEKTSLYPLSNRVNGDENIKGVDLEEADGYFDLDAMNNRGDDGDLYPGSSDASTFDLFSTPSSDSYFYDDSTSFESGISLEDIRETEGLVSFVHKRVYSNSGENCQLAHIALEGTNRAGAAPHWFEFSMLRAGSLHVNTRAAGQPTHAKLFLSCDAATPLQEAISYNDGSAYDELYLKHLPEGQKIWIQWQTIEGETTDPFSFEIRIEDKVNASDSLALIALYNSTDGANWRKKQNWLQTPVSGWEGVQVENGRVAALEFSAAGLKGSVPDAFYDLTALRTLVIEGNQLNGSLDSQLAAFVKLEKLHIREPQLSGTFMPELSSLARLREIHLQDIRINEELPADIGLLTQLELLKVIDAELSGTIPASLGDALRLREINLSANRLHGAVPPEIGALSSLETFVADKNLLSGILPSELLALPALKRLSLEDNLLTALPENLFSSNTLTFINLSRNRLSGSLPTAVDRTREAALHLDLSENTLSGSLSAALEGLYFSVLDLSQNSLGGQLPALKVKNFLGLAANRFKRLPSLADVNDGKLILTAAHNQLTFDDLLPNAAYLQCSNCSPSSERYSPQDTLQQDTLLIIRETDPVDFAVPFDNGLATNQYQWYRNGQPLTEQTGPSLSLTDFSSQQEGEYSCHVSNAGLPGLVLLLDNIRLERKPKQEQQITVADISPVHYESPDFTLDASAGSGLPLTFSLLKGPVNLEGKLVKIQGTGEVIIKAVQSGNADFLPAEEEIQFTIARAGQQIIPPDIKDKVFGDPPFSLSAEASSGLPVAMSVEKGQVALNEPVLSLQGAGLVEIALSQPGNDNYKAAPPVVLRFEVAKATQEIRFETIPDQELGSEPLALQATSDAQLPVAFRVIAGQARIEDSSQLYLEDDGEVTVEAYQPGDKNYLSAQPVQRTFTVTRPEKVPQAITVAEVPDTIPATESLLLEWSASSALPVGVVVEGPAVLVDKELFFTAAGTVNLLFEQSGDSTYAVAEPVSLKVHASKVEQKISFTAPSEISLSKKTLRLNATSSSGLAVNYRVIQGNVNLLGDQLELLDSGPLVIEAYEAGNDIYLPAEAVRVQIEVLPPELLSQTIEYRAIPDLVYSPEPLVLGFTASSGLPLNIIVSGPANLQGNTLSMQAAGTVAIRVYQRGNETYAASDTLDLSFEILPAPQSINFEAVMISETSYELQASASSGLPVSFEVVSGEAEIAGNILLMKGTEDVIISAHQAGDSRYKAADPARLTLSNGRVTAIDGDQTKTLKVYPNPSQAVFFLHNTTFDNQTELLLYDSRGALLKKWGDASTLSAIDLSEYQVGVYQLIIRSEGALKAFRLIKK